MNVANSLVLAAALAGGPIADPPDDPSLYSFADIYRLTVSGAAPAPAALAGASAGEASAVREPRFFVSAPEPAEPWALLVSGLALAGWVAHRRLVHPL